MLLLSQTEVYSVILYHSPFEIVLPSKTHIFCMPESINENMQIGQKEPIRYFCPDWAPFLLDKYCVKEEGTNVLYTVDSDVNSHLSLQ